MLLNFDMRVSCDCIRRLGYFQLLRDNYYSCNNYNSIRADVSVLQHAGDLIISMAVDCQYFPLGTHLHFQPQSIAVCAPTWGRGTPFPLVPSLPHLLLFFTFPFLGGFNYFLLLSIPFLSTRIVPLRF